MLTRDDIDELEFQAENILEEWARIGLILDEEIRAAQNGKYMHSQEAFDLFVQYTEMLEAQRAEYHAKFSEILEQLARFNGRRANGYN